MPNPPTTIRFDPVTDKMIDQLAQDIGVSRSDIIRMAVRKMYAGPATAQEITQLRSVLQQVADNGTIAEQQPASEHIRYIHEAVRMAQWVLRNFPA